MQDDPHSTHMIEVFADECSQISEVATAEALARAQYARRRDPYECTLLYLALGKTSLLAGLFRQVLAEVKIEGDNALQSSAIPDVAHSCHCNIL
eukprot:1156048-Pelagomonas_calceolata.AAC.4